MQKTITTIEISCDICGAEKITPVAALHKETFGYRPTEAFGVAITAVAFGAYCTHVCADCARKALHAAIDADRK